MATDISLLNNVVQITVDDGQPEAYSGVAYKYSFNAAGTILTVKTDFESFNIPLADLRIAGAGTAPADAEAAYTALSTVFPDAGSAGGGGLGYLVYTALLTQSGTDAPVATVLENTLGGTVVWTRGGVGSYTGTLVGAFIINKTILILGNPTSTSDVFGFGRADADSLYLDTASAGTPQDALLYETSIEIRVYPV